MVIRMFKELSENSNSIKKEHINHKIEPVRNECILIEINNNL